jgi:hypothetical protein
MKGKSVVAAGQVNLGHFFDASEAGVETGSVQAQLFCCTSNVASTVQINLERFEKNAITSVGVVIEQASYPRGNASLELLFCHA